MDTKSLPYSRRVQILSMLAAHGPLSIRAIDEIIVPKIKRTRLSDVLKRLENRGLITKRYDNIFGSAGVFYQITQTHSRHKYIFKIAPSIERHIRQPYFVHKDLLHSECCAIWTDRLKSMFPEANILRDHEFSNSPLALRLLLIEENELEHKPDILVIFNGNGGIKHASFAVEIERTEKSEKRLMEKIRKLSNKSLVDGVVYICHRDIISKRLKRIYLENVLGRAARIKHYGRNFFLFSDGSFDGASGQVRMFNSSLDEVSFINWARILIENKITLRRDVMFQHSGCAP